MLLKIKSTLRKSITIPTARATRFFKTGPGDYAEDDEFIGVTVPNLRKIAKDFTNLTLNDLKILIASKFNEERLLALIILVAQYKKAKPNQQKEIYQFYINHLEHINNWNLVDSSAHFIIGAYLWDKDKASLFTLAKSEVLWKRRIAIVSTWYFIAKNDFEWTFKIADILINDTHDLIHKAVGWMLREAGKRDQAKLIDFLNQNSNIMPRTMLRYALEKFPEQERKKYLQKS